jgi:hypothetical protein
MQKDIAQREIQNIRDDYAGRNTILENEAVLLKE